MTLDAQWLALEEESVGDRNSWRLRLARPLDGYSLFVAVQGGRRHLLLRAARPIIPPRATWPDCAGLELLAVELEGIAYFGVALRETRFADVFAALAEDLARRIEAAPDSEAVAVFSGQLARWRRFLAATAEGLGEEARRGLWGELHVLLEILLPVFGRATAGGWTGPHAAHQDFQFPGAWIEVKTTLAKQPQAVRVTSERQLDDTHAPALFLHVLVLEAVETGSSTLPALIARVRSELNAWPNAREQFEDALLAARYLDLHASRYEGLGYAVRRQDTFRVGPGFPRIIEADLPTGVGDASYSLSLAACQSFSVPLAALISALHDTPSAS
jgi:hypothetical protein